MRSFAAFHIWLLIGLVALVAGVVPSLASEARAADDGRIIYTPFGSGGSPTQLDMSGTGTQAPFEVPPFPTSNTNSSMSPDGSKVAYVVFGELDDDNVPIEDDALFVMNSDGTGLVEVAVGSGIVAPDRVGLTLGSWAPDSAAFTYTQTRLRPTGDGGETVLGEDVFRVDADGANQQNLTDSGTGRGGMWSPDGTKIAFVSDSLFAVTPKVALMNPDGTNVTVLTEAQVLSPGLRWFPDSTRIAFDAFSAPEVTDIYWVAVSGGPAVRVTMGPENRQRLPFGDFRGGWTPTGGMSSISPDGSHMTFHSRDIDDFTSGTAYVASVDGSTITELPVGPGEYAPGRSIVYSPDGSRIAYNGYPTDFGSGSPAIYVADADGSNAEKVAEGLLIDWIPGSVPVGDPLVGLVDPAQGLWHLFDDAGVLTTQFFFGNPGDYPIVGDWNCDGVETPGMYRQSDGYVYLRNSNTQGAADIRFFFGDPGDVPIAGDFNSDGCDTVSIYRPSSQTFYIINELGKNDGGLGAAEFSYVFGDPGDKPFVGDFNGDGAETVGLHRESTGLVYFRNSHSQGNADAQFIFGDPGDRLIAGDWNGNGSYSPALFRPSNTTMFFRYTNTQGNADNQFIPNPSESSWLPVAGTFG